MASFTFLRSSLAGGFFALLLTPLTWAAPRAGEGGHSLSISGGVANPSITTSVYQNPAGLIYNNWLKAQLEAFVYNEDFDPGAGGGVFFGNNTFGGGLGASHAFVESGPTSIYYGAAAYIGMIKTSLGVGGTTTIANGGGGTTLNIGMMLNPHGEFRLGAVAYDLARGFAGTGVGIALDLNRAVTIVGDAAANTRFDRYRIKPGIAVGVPEAGLTVSYGFDVGSRNRGGGAVPGIEDKASVGAHIELGRSLTWQIYYHVISYAYTSLAFRF